MQVMHTRYVAGQPVPRVVAPEAHTLAEEEDAREHGGKHHSEPTPIPTHPPKNLPPSFHKGYDICSHAQVALEQTLPLIFRNDTRRLPDTPCMEAKFAPAALIEKVASCRSPQPSGRPSHTAARPPMTARTG